MLTFQLPCTDRSGEHLFEAELLWEMGKNYGLTPQRIANIWKVARHYQVLFSDETQGKFEPFLFALLSPTATWFEIRHYGDPAPVGLAYITSIKPGFDADAHFAFWDSIAGGREPLILFIAEWCLDRYRLHRLNVQVPPYQSGVLRFVKRLGFKEEGEMREAVVYKGRRWPLLLFGMTEEELDERMQSLY